MTARGMADAHDGLPKQFVASLKILFDILDEDHTGLIHLRDIESRWSDEGVKDLPLGVMEGLKKVVPPNGLLTFENFVAGLRLALFRGNDQWKRRSVNVGAPTQKENRNPIGSAQIPINTRHPTSPNHPLQSAAGNRQQGNAPVDSNTNNKHVIAPGKRSAIPHLQQRAGSDARPTTAAVKPQQASASTSNRQAFSTSVSPSSEHIHSTFQTARSGPPPPLPERSQNPQMLRKLLPGSDVNPPKIPPRDHWQNQKLVNDHQSLQREWVGNKAGTSPTARDRAQPSDDSHHHAIYANIEQFQKKEEESLSQGRTPEAQGPGKATVRRHGSGRRHTLQNGVDHNLIKRMQQLEEESSMLKRGLEMVDMARDWYLRQLGAMQDKQRMLGKVNYNDNSLEAHQERMNFQRARISEVNMQLRTLVDSSEKGFPLHMNLALIPNKGSPPSSDPSVKLVREQNRRLTQELSEKSDKIAKLEQEKASLIRELFEARSKHKSTYDDTTFM